MKAVAELTFTGYTRASQFGKAIVIGYGDSNIFFNLIETEDRIAADERFEGLSSNDALEIYKVLSDQLIRTHIYAAHIGSGISSRIAMSILSSGSFLL